jgi:hypothetical protein
MDFLKTTRQRHSALGCLLLTILRVKASEAQMDMDLSEDDLLGKENEVSDAARDFVGVKKGHSVSVTAASLTHLGPSSAPARLPQQQLSVMTTVTDQKGQQQRATIGAGVQAAGANQQASQVVEEQTEVPKLSDGTAEGVVESQDQHLGILSEAMLQAGLAADGGVHREMGSVMTMAVLSDGELTPVRRSKRNADVADVHVLEKAEKRIAYKNLEEPRGNASAVINSFTSFSSDRIEQNLGGIGITLVVKIS